MSCVDEYITTLNGNGDDKEYILVNMYHPKHVKNEYMMLC